MLQTLGTSRATRCVSRSCLTNQSGQWSEPGDLGPHPAWDAGVARRPFASAAIAPAAVRGWLLIIPCQYTPVSRRLHCTEVQYSPCTLGQWPIVRLARGLWPESRGSPQKNEPRPPIRVEAPLPRWAQVTRIASAVAAASRMRPRSDASAWPWGQSDRPTGLCPRRNAIWRTTLDCPFNSIPSVTPTSESDRYDNGSWPAGSLALRKPLYQAGSARASSKGTLCTCTFGYCPFGQVTRRKQVQKGA